ncbi:MAG: hypothetical protein GY716_16010 [bacterium]|nr:hypothetical protein [bacterium]
MSTFADIVHDIARANHPEPVDAQYVLAVVKRTIPTANINHVYPVMSDVGRRPGCRCYQEGVLKEGGRMFLSVERGLDRLERESLENGSADSGDGDGDF